MEGDVETQAQALPGQGSLRPVFAALVIDLLVTFILQAAAVLTVVWRLRPWTVVIPVAVATVPLAVALRALTRSRRTGRAGAWAWLAVAWAFVIALAAAAWILCMYFDVFAA
jgi:hypothetical protein